MTPSILLCGEGGDAAAAAEFGFEAARARRMTRSEAERVAARVLAAYEEVCRTVLPLAAEGGKRPEMRLTLDPESLAPRFDFVRETPRRTPPALRALRIRALLDARATRAAGRRGAPEFG